MESSGTPSSDKSPRNAVTIVVTSPYRIGAGIVGWLGLLLFLPLAHDSPVVAGPTLVASAIAFGAVVIADAIARRGRARAEDREEGGRGPQDG